MYIEIVFMTLLVMILFGAAMIHFGVLGLIGATVIFFLIIVVANGISRKS